MWVYRENGGENKMADNILSVKIKQRYDTESNWSANNPVLLAGEAAYSSDRNGMYKIGNGTSTWSQLPYNNANTANTATSATKATQDSAGQQINTTYIKGLSVSGTTVTYTKGDGSTGTITTQDTNTTYSNATTSAAGLMSSSDKSKLNGIPSPTTSDNDKILSVVNGAYSLITVTNAEGVKY